jgi:DNA repair protein RadC
MDPSSDDVVLTQRLVTAGSIVQVKVLDSIIVGVDVTDSSKFVSYSFVEHGIMPVAKTV